MKTEKSQRAENRSRSLRRAAAFWGDPLPDPAENVRRDLIAVRLVEDLMPVAGIHQQGHVLHFRGFQPLIDFAHTPAVKSHRILLARTQADRQVRGRVCDE